MLQSMEVYFILSWAVMIGLVYTPDHHGQPITSGRLLTWRVFDKFELTWHPMQSVHTCKSLGIIWCGRLIGFFGFAGWYNKKFHDYIKIIIIIQLCKVSRFHQLISWQSHAFTTLMHEHNVLSQYTTWFDL
jgi:hypothetical protein